MDSFELAWKVIDYFQKDYASKADMIDELGNLDELALEISSAIEELELTEENDIQFIAIQVEMKLF